MEMTNVDDELTSLCADDENRKPYFRLIYDQEDKHDDIAKEGGTGAIAKRRVWKEDLRQAAKATGATVVCFLFYDPSLFVGRFPDLKSPPISLCMLAWFPATIDDSGNDLRLRQRQNRTRLGTEKFDENMPRSVKWLVLPAAHEAESIWSQTFGFERITVEQLSNFRKTCWQLTFTIHRNVNAAKNGSPMSDY